MLKISEITKLNKKEIEAKVSDLKLELFNMKMQRVSSGLEKPHRVKEIRKDIARLLTVKNTKSEK
jgi:large subunit ribosomal protein L29